MIDREAEVDKWVQAEPDDRELEQAERDRRTYDFPVPTQTLFDG